MHQGPATDFKADLVSAFFCPASAKAAADLVIKDLAYARVVKQIDAEVSMRHSREDHSVAP